MGGVHHATLAQQQSRQALIELAEGHLFNQLHQLGHALGEQRKHEVAKHRCGQHLLEQGPRQQGQRGGTLADAARVVVGMAEQAAGTDDTTLARQHPVQRQFAAAGAELDDAYRPFEHEGEAAARLVLVEHHGGGGDRQRLHGVDDALQQAGRQFAQHRIERHQFRGRHVGSGSKVAITGAWSEGRSSLRGALSMTQARHSAASGCDSRIWSMRRPRLRRKPICR